MKDKYKDSKAMSKDHWEMDVSKSIFPSGGGYEPADAFLPMEPSKRPTPHKKINECDH